MTTFSRTAAMTLAGLLLLSGAAGAATIEDLELRDHWMGQKWDVESLKGRTVVVEFWGFN